MSTFVRRSGKGETVATENRSVAAGLRASGAAGLHRGSTREALGGHGSALCPDCRQGYTNVHTC